MDLSSLKGFALCLPLLLGAGFGPLGDRLVVSINNVPYTQRQIEAYINVKESLRKTNDGNVRVIDAGNWGDALQVFSEDMVILQEAQRLGSFASQDQLLDKYNAVVREKLGQKGELSKAVERLGIDDQTLARTLDDVLRIAAFRRSKDRQEAQTSGHVARKKAGIEAKLQWLDDLNGRAIVRPYDGAKTYVVIQPIATGSADAP